MSLVQDLNHCLIFFFFFFFLMLWRCYKNFVCVLINDQRVNYFYIYMGGLYYFFTVSNIVSLLLWQVALWQQKHYVRMGRAFSIVIIFCIATIANFHGNYWVYSSGYIWHQALAIRKFVWCQGTELDVKLWSLTLC